MKAVVTTMLSVVLAPALAVAQPPQTLDLAKGHWVDLTHTFTEDAICWPTGASLVALPMKIAGGSGRPTRIVAFVPEQGPVRTNTRRCNIFP
jgi:hypothetical protein